MMEEIILSVTNYSCFLHLELKNNVCPLIHCKHEELKVDMQFKNSHLLF